MTSIQSSELPPPLAWIPGFTKSLSGAIGSNVEFMVTKTVNPLVYKVRLLMGERVSGRDMLIVWNLFQQYAAKNEAIPQGKVEREGPVLTSEVIIRTRLGLPKDAHPTE